MLDTFRWRDNIGDKIEAELQATTQPGKRCLLLQTRGFLYLMPEPGKEHKFSIDPAIDSWLELASLADKAYLFPLEDFADRLTQILELSENFSFAGDHPDFEKLTQQIDELLTKRHGGFVAAEKCRNRAVALYKQGKLLRAIKEIHKAKVKWFARETLRGSLLATLFISNCYQEMGLAFAAKYYALVVAHIAIHSQDDDVQSLISRALIDAASCDYSLGSYCGFFDLTDVGLAALNAFSTDIDASSIENEINKSVFHTSIIRTLTKRLNRDLLIFVDGRIKNWLGLEEYFDELIPKAEGVWSDKNISEIWAVLEEQMCDRPFSDLGHLRSVKFLALGVTWKFRWENTYELTPIAEEILSVLQVLLADFANIDWYLLRTTVEVEIRFGVEREVGIQQLPSNELGRWRLTLTDIKTREELDNIALELAVTLLEHTSLLPTEEFLDRIEIAFREGLSDKAFFGQRYSILYREFVDKEKFESSNRRSKVIPEANRSFNPILHHQLSWYSGPGPGYSEEAAKEALENRYTRSIIPIQHTLKRLSQEQPFKDTVRNLRASGWLDWHILNAMSMVVLNYRVNKEIGSASRPETYEQRLIELMNQPEDENADSVPLSEFSEQNLRLYLWFSMGSTLKNLGFELRQMTPDFEAISDFW
jgi:hypothetical protein